MSMVIAKNMQAINTKRQFATSARGMSGAMEKLSSGYKINTGKDDPSGLVVSEKLRSQINGLKRAQQNTEEGINVMGIAEGALNEMNNILKKMKALAIHSNNTGVTSPEQIAADQAEMDSAIQTLDRIAQNTKFSNENLLNGAKDLDFTVKTAIQGTQNNALVNGRESEFTQIFKRDGYAVSVNFTGTQAADELTSLGEVDFTQQAMKAYMEVDTSNDPGNTAQVENGKFTQKQSFTLTGSRGSRAFTVKKGETVATLVNQIKSATGQTGIDAALVFNSDQKIDMTTTGAAQDGEYGPSSFKIAGLVDSNGKDVSFTLQPTEELQALMPQNGFDFSVSVDNAGIVALNVNGTSVTEFWDGSAANLEASLRASTNPIGQALADSLSMSGNIDLDKSDFDAEYTFGDFSFAAGEIVIENVFGEKLPDGTHNGQVTVDLTGITGGSALDLDAIYANLSDSQKEKFVADVKAGNLRVEARMVGSQSNINVALSLVGDNGSYVTESINMMNAGAPNYNGAGVNGAAGSVFAGANVKMVNAVTTNVGYVAGDQKNAGRLDGITFKTTTPFTSTGKVEAKAPKASGAATAPVDTGGVEDATELTQTFAAMRGDATALTMTFGRKAGTTDADFAALATLDITLKLQANPGAEKGEELYTISALVDGQGEYILTDTWDGKSAIDIDPAKVQSSGGSNLAVAKALGNMTLTSNANATGLNHAAAGLDVDYTAGSRINTDSITVSTGLYGDGSIADQGKIEVRFNNFDPSAIFNALSPENAKILKEALASGTAQLSAKTEALPLGAWRVGLTLTDKDGKELAMLGSFDSAGSGITVDVNNGETTGWNTLTGSLAGVEVRITNSVKKSDFGYNANKGLNPDADVTATSNDVAATATMVSAESNSNYRLTGFTAASASTQTGGTARDGSAARQVGTVAVFNNKLVTDAKGNSTGAVEKGVTSVDITADGVASIQLGKNTDGQGRIYVKFTDDNSYELYKDSSMSQESLVATGIKGAAIKEANNSGLNGMVLDFTGTELTKHKGTYFTLAGIEGTSTTTDANGVSRDGVTYTRDVANETDTDAFFQEERTLITGVELGKNTDVDGKIHTKAVYDHENNTVQVFAYKDARMRDEDMVASSEALEIGDAESMSIVLNEKRNADQTAGTGLGMVMSTDDMAALKGLTKDTTVKGEITFNNLGARIFTEDYGSDAVLKITQDEGSIFTYYGSGGASERQVIDGADKNKSSIQLNGQDATLSINGMQVKTSGLDLSLATQDIQAHLTFNKGKVGSTTLAQVGYDDGSIFTKIGALNLKSVEAETDGKYAGLSGLLANAGHVTSETIGDFKGGMQLQLGEGSGDSNRTVVAIKSLTSENLGRVTKGGYWDGDAVYTERTLTMKDVLGSNVASLKSDATLAMEIIDQAISDVSELRATIGAFQSNLLQTNSNNLAVTIENITKTESGIRDADMADEMTDFTKNQVLQNAAMSMMSNANANAQNVLQLLR